MKYGSVALLTEYDITYLLLRPEYCDEYEETRKEIDE